MLRLNEKLLKLVEDRSLGLDLFRGKFGLEKENVRVSMDGKLALTDHPKTFGDKQKNPYITTDFSESQVEVITPPMESLESAYQMLETLHNIVSLNLEDELLWPQSLPPILPDESEIPIARFGDTPKSEASNLYREMLTEKYGKKKQMISGIHFNFSLSDKFLEKLHLNSDSKLDFREFKDQFYIRIMRHTIKYSWFLINLLGSSPDRHDSYATYCKECNSGTSIRNGSCGYNNLDDYYVPLDNLSNYVKAVDELIELEHLASAREYYSIIRPKNSSGNHNLLMETGIEYIELRLVDLNPLFKLGISQKDLYLLHIFLLTMGLLDDESMDESDFREAIKNNRMIADQGRRENLKVIMDKESRGVSDVSLDILSRMFDLARLNTRDEDKYLETISDFKSRINNPEQMYSQLIYKQLNDEGFIGYHIRKAKEYLEESHTQEFNFIGYEDMELSTQILILDAIRRGIKVEILDRYENFIKLKVGSKVEIVKQATKTSKDNYSSVLAMENKAVTKKILRESSIATPSGGIYESFELALLDYEEYMDKEIVIKPNSTNFGIGITIFTHRFGREDYKKALELAFEHDHTVLIERFALGKEYRIFVIGDEVVAAMHRVPANVTGDSIKTIRELVEDKNKDVLRGTGYRKPLQKINLGIEESMFLAQSNMNFETIPKAGETVYLRENSNISTGGDSIDMTDEISEAYKQVALDAARALGATVTGVDLITPDITSEVELNYSVIELNFNPAIHIHCYPYKGENRHLGDKILDHLGFDAL